MKPAEEIAKDIVESLYGKDEWDAVQEISDAIRQARAEAFEEAVSRIETLAFAHVTKQHMGLLDPLAALGEAAKKVRALAAKERE